MSVADRPRWSQTTKLTVVIFALALFVYLLFRFSAVLPPLILAIILAYILSPAVNFVERYIHLPRGLAILLAYLFLLGSIGLVLLLIIPPFIEQLSGLGGDIQNIITSLEKFLGHRYILGGFVIDFEALINKLSGSIQSAVSPYLGRTITLAIEILSSIVWVVFIAVVAFYFIKDGQKINDWFEKIVPPLYRNDYLHLRKEISQIWGAFFRGQIILATVVTILFTGVGFILGLPFPLAMAIFAGLMEFLPSLGHGIWLFFASLLALFFGSTWLPIPNWIFMLIVIGMHLIYEQFDLNYLIPRIIGRSVHLPPVVVILGIVGGALLAGFLGVFLAAPTIASLRVIGRYIYANVFDLEPFPESMSTPLPPPNPRWWHRLLPRIERT
ncbi:MAG: AI-2E family transporter [Anaerolineales bacterium]